MNQGKTLALAALLAAPGLACTAGFNSLEQSADCADGTIRTRALNNLAQEVGGAELSYHGANELNDYDGATYSGVQRLMVRKKGSKVKGLLRVCTAGDGSARAMPGVRLPNIMGDFGFTDISSDENGANVTIFTGKALGDKNTVEFLHSQNWAYRGKPGAYSEIQFNRNLGKHCEGLIRAATPNYTFHKTGYTVGFRVVK